MADAKCQKMTNYRKEGRGALPINACTIMRILSVQKPKSRLSMGIDVVSVDKSDFLTGEISFCKFRHSFFNAMVKMVGCSNTIFTM